MLIKELNQALNDFQQIVKITDGSPESLFDFHSLVALKSSVEEEVDSYWKAYKMFEKTLKINSTGYIFSDIDILFYMGVMKFYQNEFLEAIKLFVAAFKKKFGKEENEEEEGCYRVNSGIFNQFEYVYNVLLCYLLIPDLAQVLKYTNELFLSIPESLKPNLLILKKLIIAKKGNFSEEKFSAIAKPLNLENLLEEQEPEIFHLLQIFP